MKRKNISGRKNSTFKGPKVRIDLACSRNRKQFCELSIRNEREDGQGSANQHKFRLHLKCSDGYCQLLKK